MTGFNEQWAQMISATKGLASYESMGMSLAREAYENGRAEPIVVSQPQMNIAPMMRVQPDYAALFRDYCGRAMQGLLVRCEIRNESDLAKVAVTYARALVEAVRREES